MIKRKQVVFGAAILLGGMVLAGCGTSGHPLASAPHHPSQTVSPAPAVSPATSSTTPSSGTSTTTTTTPSSSPVSSSPSSTTPSSQSSPSHTLTQLPTPQPSSTPSSISQGQSVVVTSTKGFSENATLFPTGWQVSDNTPNTTSILIANQNGANFVSYQLGIAYNTLPSSPIGMLDPSQANRNSNVQWHIVSQKSISLWDSATTVAIQGDSTQNGQPYNWALITYKKVHGFYYFVTGTVGIHAADYQNGVFQQNFQRLVQGFSITNHT